MSADMIVLVVSIIVSVFFTIHSVQTIVRTRQRYYEEYLKRKRINEVPR